MIGASMFKSSTSRATLSPATMKLVSEAISTQASALQPAVALRTVSDVFQEAADREPLTHVKTFASDAMAGRRGGTEGFNMASKHVSDVLGRYDVKGPTGEVNPFFQSFALSPSRARKVQNVVGLVEGTGPHKDEAIVVLAHLDHMGSDGDQIWRGADDNASGSGTLLSMVPELMELKKKGKLDRSVIVLWTAAEEEGLVGARYFLQHPLPGFPLEKIKGAINMDMIGRWEANRISVIDTDAKGKPTFFRDLLESANSHLAAPFERINRDLGAFRRRHDGYEFESRGIPMLMFFEGLSNPNGGGSLHREYHAPTDTVDLIIRDNNGEKMRKIRDLATEVAVEASQLAGSKPSQEVVLWEPRPVTKAAA